MMVLLFYIAWSFFLENSSLIQDMLIVQYFEFALWWLHILCSLMQADGRCHTPHLFRVHCFICCALLLLACIKNGTELLRTECISGSLQLFTDAGQYAIRFGDAGLNRKFGLASDVSAVLILVLHKPRIEWIFFCCLPCLVNCYLPDRDPCHKLWSQIDELHVVRQLSLPERAVALALAVSLDCDYFSKRGGW